MTNARLPDVKDVKGNTTDKLIIDVAHQLFRQIGFQKTTVADIARELDMSPANVYRFFSAKSKLNEAVCDTILSDIEAEAAVIAQSDGTASHRIRSLIISVEKAHRRRFLRDHKLHELVESAVHEDWATLRRHTNRMIEILQSIIAEGMRSGEFPPGDPLLAARLVNTACLRFTRPSLIAEYDEQPMPTVEEMVQFCLIAIHSGSTRESRP